MSDVSAPARFYAMQAKIALHKHRYSPVTNTLARKTHMLSLEGPHLVRIKISLQIFLCSLDLITKTDSIVQT